VLYFDEVQAKDKGLTDKLKPLMLSGAEWGIVEELVKVLELAEKMILIFQLGIQRPCCESLPLRGDDSGQIECDEAEDRDS
jgi:hypothetical protein